MNKLRIPEGRLNAAIRAAYDLSHPQGMGYLHFNPKPMTEEQAQKIIDDQSKWGRINLDYVSGRAVKLTFYVDEEGHYVIDGEGWFDHSDENWMAFKHLIIGEGETA